MRVRGQTRVPCACRTACCRLRACRTCTRRSAQPSRPPGGSLPASAARATAAARLASGKASSSPRASSRLMSSAQLASVLRAATGHAARACAGAAGFLAPLRQHASQPAVGELLLTTSRAAASCVEASKALPACHAAHLVLLLAMATCSSSCADSRTSSAGSSTGACPMRLTSTGSSPCSCGPRSAWQPRVQGQRRACRCWCEGWWQGAPSRSTGKQRAGRARVVMCVPAVHTDQSRARCTQAPGG